MLDLRCRFGFHDYDYFTMTRLDGGTEHHRCCLRCEKSELLIGDADVEQLWAVAREKTPLFATAADIALLNSDAAQAKTPQDIGRANLLALFGVTTPTGLDEG